MNQAYEISHLLSGVMLVTSFALLYQERIAAVLNAFAAQSIVLSLAVAWAAWSGNRPDLFITALIAFTLKGIVIPVALRRTVMRLTPYSAQRRSSGATSSYLTASGSNPANACISSAGVNPWRPANEVRAVS